VARSLNKVQLIGNLTRDPELRYTPQGTAVCDLGIATNRSWKPQDSAEWQEETELHSVVVWSKLAERCGEQLTKGKKVYVEGRLRTRSWEGSEGEKKYKTEIVADEVMFLDAKGREEGSSEEHQAPKASHSASAKASQQAENQDVNPDEIPF
jgi:single-strand DNA-binding protein